MNYPSIKTLQTIPDVSRETAINIRAVLKSASVNAITETSDAALAYVRQCYHAPPIHMVKMYAIDELLNTYGVEGFTEHGVSVDYCNTGDSYAATICRVVRKGRATYRVTSWGDIVEREL